MQTLTEVKGGNKLAELRKKIADGKPVSPATAALAKALDSFVAVGKASIIDIEVRRQRAMGNKVKKYKPKKTETVTQVQVKDFGIIEAVEKRVLKRLDMRRKEAKKKFMKACSAAQREYRRELLGLKIEEKATKKKVRVFAVEMLENLIKAFRK